ncbi:hypothetical protein HDV00_011043 [Rhizophlyctis rosea]|nr:hypothetical protein HDV00_011043 [Rhizophlyctis rosea]
MSGRNTPQPVFGAISGTSPLGGTATPPPRPQVSTDPFGDLFGGSGSVPQPIGGQSSLPLNAASRNNIPPQSGVGGAPKTDAWGNLDFLASGGVTGQSGHSAAQASADDPFDIGFLGAQKPSPSSTAPAAHEDDNPLGILARPVQLQPALPPRQPSPQSSPQPAAPSPPPQRPALSPSPESSHDLEIATIVEMGFPAASAQAALEATNYHLGAAIEMLVQDRDAGRQLGRETPRSRVGSAQPPGDRSEARAARSRVQWEDDGVEDEDVRNGAYGSLGGGEDGYPGAESRTRRQGRREDEDERAGAGMGVQGQLNQEKLVAAAGALGKSVFKNAQTMLAFSKKKLGEAVEKAQQQIEVAREAMEEREDGAGGGGSGAGWSGYGRGRGREESARRDGGGGGAGGWNDPDAPGRYRDDSSDEEELSRSRTGSAGVNRDMGAEDKSSKFAALFAKADAASETSSSDDESPRPDPQAKYQASFRQHGQRTTSPQRPNQFPASKPPYGAPPPSSFPPAQVQPAKPTPSPLPRPKTPPPTVIATPTQLETSTTHKDRGNTLFKQGQFGDAESAYTLAITALPAGHTNLIALYNNRCAARLKTGHYKEAIEDADEVLKIDGRDVKSLLRRAMAWEGLEKWEEARGDYRKIMGIDAGVKGVSQGLARCNKALAPPEVEVKKAPTPTPTPKSGLGDFEGFVKPAFGTG